MKEKFETGDILLHCKGFEVMIHSKLKVDNIDCILYAKADPDSVSGNYSFWIRPEEMFYDNHSNGMPRFEYKESLDLDELEIIKNGNIHTKYLVARHSETLEYYVVDLVENKIIHKINER